MNGRAILRRASRRDAVAWGVVLVIALVPLIAVAQEGRARGPQLSAEELSAAWALQAKHVAGKLGLSEEASGKVLTAYQEARGNLSKAIEAGRQQLAAGGEGQGQGQEGARLALRRAQNELVSKERESFAKALGTFLTEEQAKQVSERLGPFDSRWDMLVHTVAGFNLGEKQGDALEAVNTYIVESAKLWQSTETPGADRTALREKMGALRESLDGAILPLLSEDQKTAWQAATALRRGPRDEAQRGEGLRGAIVGEGRRGAGLRQKNESEEGEGQEGQAGQGQSQEAGKGTEEQ